MPQLSRRAFLTGAAGAGVTIGAAGLLTGCGAGAGLAPALRVPPLTGLTWTLTPDNQPIRVGLAAERGATLEVASWPSYVSPAALNDFARASGCSVQLTTFSTPAGLLRGLASPGRFDVVLGVPVGVLAELVGGQLIQPLNHSYLPDSGALWTVLRNPYYDTTAAYTVPCGVYTTGIAWRKDKVTANPYAMANGWEFAWLPRYREKVGILSDYREAISLGLLRSGTPNLNTADPLDLNEAEAALTQLTGRTGRIGDNAAGSLLTGQAWIHQARSCDIAALSREPRDGPAGAIGYWFPPSGFGPVACDSATITRGARHPVLAHRFLNSLLQAPAAIASAGYSGRTPPLTSVTPSMLIRDGVLAPGLVSAAPLQETMRRGLIELPLAEPAAGLWQRAWNEVSGQA